MNDKGLISLIFKKQTSMEKTNNVTENGKGLPGGKGGGER